MIDIRIDQLLKVRKRTIYCLAKGTGTHYLWVRLKIRDAVFKELIRISPASNYMEEQVTGPGGLLSRGLLEDHATSHGALPRTKQKCATLAASLSDYVRDIIALSERKAVRIFY